MADVVINSSEEIQYCFLGGLALQQLSDGSKMLENCSVVEYFHIHRISQRATPRMQNVYQIMLCLVGISHAPFLSMDAVVCQAYI